MNQLVKEWVVFNVISLALSSLLILLGWAFVDAFFIALLLVSAMLLIGGGAVGFFLTSVSFDTILRFFRRRGEKESEDEIDEGRGVVKNGKQKKAERRQQINTGKSMAIVGALLLGEALLFSLLYALL